jgi:hypothetical protein
LLYIEAEDWKGYRQKNAHVVTLQVQMSFDEQGTPMGKDGGHCERSLHIEDLYEMWLAES